MTNNINKRFGLKKKERGFFMFSFSLGTDHRIQILFSNKVSNQNIIQKIFPLQYGAEYFNKWEVFP